MERGIVGDEPEPLYNEKRKNAVGRRKQKQEDWKQDLFE